MSNREFKETPIEYEKQFINCDNPKCDYSEEIQKDDLKNWLNKPCPNCSENLLTQDDYDLSTNLLDLINSLNNVLPNYESKTIKLSVQCHNDNILIKEREK